MQEISLAEMLKAGMHFGHKVSKRHPKMDPFIFTNKNGLHIIDLEKTKEKLEQARAAARDLASQKKIILFVGTKKQAQVLVQKYAQECGMPFLTEHWIGGLITNFHNVSRSMRELRRLKRDKKRGDFEKYTKKEKLELDEEIEKLEKMVGGMENMERLPDALFLVDIKEDKTAVQEAVKKGILTLAVTDTNTNPEVINYPIPANDDALKSIEYVLKIMSQAIKEGQSQAAVEQPKEVQKAEDKTKEK